MEHEGPAPTARLGAELRAARQKLGWELPELSNSLHIRLIYLEAIEAGRMADLPGPAYALGFVRAYATALGLSGDEIAKRFRAEGDEAGRKPRLSFPAPVPQRGVPAGALILVGIGILAVAYGGWYWVSEHRATRVETVPAIPDRLAPLAATKAPPSPQVASILPSTAPSPPPPTPHAVVPTPEAPAPAAVEKPPAPPAPGAAAATAQNAPAPAATPPAEPGTAPRLVIRTSADAWVLIKPATGPALLNRLMKAGDSFSVPADAAELSLTTGNAGGTQIELDGAALPSLGGSGAVVRNLALNPETLKTEHFPVAGRPHPKPAA